ncbi:MAG: enoyl-CoA hydratase/isomerase family protein [Planctomycetes bacterium]|nr:enoyl-CoA hydratase/isomerase family protein [Planctomycetota bacterium]
MADDQQCVTSTDQDQVRTITLNRPTVLNACNRALLAALGEAVTAAAVDRSVRCLLITGAGRAFCSGQDLVELKQRVEAGSPINLEQRLRERYNPIISTIRTMAKPVVAAVNGVAAGAGASLALACDLRVAAESATFIQAFVRIGLVSDAGSTFMLPRLVGAARAAELAFTGRTLDASEAQRIGLVNRVVPDEELPAAAVEYAAQLAALPTRAVGLMKQMLNAAWAANLDEQLELEARLQTTATQTEDHQEGLAAFFEKRPAQFAGR